MAELGYEPHLQQAELLHNFWNALKVEPRVETRTVDPNKTAKRSHYISRLPFWHAVVRAAQAAEIGQIGHDFGSSLAVLRTSTIDPVEPAYAFVTDRYARWTYDIPRWATTPLPEKNGIVLGAGMSIAQLGVDTAGNFRQTWLTGTHVGSSADFDQIEASARLIVGGDENAIILAEVQRTDIKKHMQVDLAAFAVTSEMYNARYTF